MPGKESRHFDTTEVGWQDLVAAQAEKWDSEGRNVFCGVGLRSRDFGSGSRGTKRDVDAFPGFLADIDIVGDGHKATNCAPDVAAVVQKILFPFVQGGGLEPTLVVHSGGGLHVYWLFDHPLLVTGENRAAVQAESEAWQERLAAHARAAGWVWDYTADLARVLRPAGTHNRKTSEPRPVRVLGGCGVRYSYETLIAVPRTAAAPTPPPALPAADASAAADDRVSSEIIDGARAKLKATRHGERRTIINSILKGEPFAQTGERDRTLQKIASWIAWGDPEADPEILAEVLRPSLDKMAEENPGDHLSFEDAVKKISRAQADALRDREIENAKKKAFTEALARSRVPSVATSPSVVAEYLPPPSEVASNTTVSPVGGTVPSPSSTSPSVALVPVSAGPFDPSSPQAQLARPHYAPEEIGEFCRQQEIFSGQVIPLEVWRKRWIIQSGEYFYVHGPNGYQKAIGRGELEVSLPRDLSPLPEEYFRWRRISDKGTVHEKTPSEVLKELGTVARDIVASMMVTQSFYDGSEQVFYEVACPLRNLEPVFDENVDKWLRLLGGDLHDKLLDWLATMTDQTRPSCAVMITGVKDAGKSMLALGCSRLWTTKGPTKMGEASANWNEDVQKCPLVVADEHLPENFSGKPVSTQWLRDLISSDRRSLHRKFQPNATLLGALRVMLVANNDDMLKLGEESLGPDALAAVAGRFLHVYAGPAAANFLIGLGGRPYTEAQGWIEGDRIPKHLMWLRANRQVIPGNRFLVEGQLSAMHQKLAIQGTIPNLVTEFLAKYLESASEHKTLGYAVYIENENLYASADGIRATWSKFIPGERGAPTLQNINAALANLAISKQQVRTKIKEPGAKIEKNRRFWQINTALVFQWNQEKGGCDDELMEKNLKSLRTLRVIDGGKKGEESVAVAPLSKSLVETLFSALRSKQ
jgi:hypothetical protein